MNIHVVGHEFLYSEIVGAVRETVKSNSLPFLTLRHNKFAAAAAAAGRWVNNTYRLTSSHQVSF